MSDPLILTYYRRLPHFVLAHTDPAALLLPEALREFRTAIRARYSEGTFARLLEHTEAEVRQAAALALGITGTLAVNAPLAAALKDGDDLVRRFAHDALWEIWFRGDDADHCWSLQQALQLGDLAEMHAALNDLIEAAPQFAEARNQRAILHFRRRDYARCMIDCRGTLRLNPWHFAAAAGLGQSCLRLKKPRAALRAFERALDIHPGLPELQDAVRTLQDALGGSHEQGG